MKKILAIAVATAIAAPAMADMTISGTVAVGYSATDATVAATTWTAAAPTTPTAAATYGDAGFGVDTATIIISGSETLENGMTVAATMGVGGLARGASVGGKDAGLTVSGDFGSVAVKAVEAGNGVFAYGSSVAEDFTGELAAAAANVDSISYTAPAMGIATVKIGYSETVGLGLGQDSAFSPDVNVALAFSDALSGFVNYKTCASDDTCKDRVRVGAKYDAGSVIVSAAMGENNNKAADVTNTVVGITVPMGATTLGANIGNTDGGTAATDRDAWSVGVKHALSSNLSVSAKYTTYDLNATADVTKSSVLMSLSF